MFTGTGNSEFVARRIAEATNDVAENISKYIRGEEKPVFTEPGAYVFVAPCNVSSTAFAMIDFLDKASFPKGAKAWFVITSAAYMGASPVANREAALPESFRDVEVNARQSGTCSDRRKTMMKLRKLTDRVWYYPFEQARDRPSLGYIRGDHWSLAVDAGHSDGHVAEFYGALEAAGLPLPALTVLTHWHWDHTFGMHAIHGLSIANDMTAGHLRQIRNRIAQDGPEDFLALDMSIRNEYAGNRPVIVTLPDVVFTDEARLDLGNCRVRLFRAESPHTDDSTLVHAVEDGVLFLGDAAAGVFPTWEKDPLRAFRLAQAIEPLDVRTCVESHCDPETRRELMDDLLSCKDMP